MLQRVAMHQTRLRLPGLGIDGKGVAIGSRGVVLLASIERLVAFLSLYTSAQSLSDLMGSLKLEVVRSKMGTREIVLSFSAQGSERMDSLAEVCRVALGHTFTGTSRHFVQYRDASAPFGFDVAEVLAADGDYLLYHNSFTQVYERERELSLASLLLRLRPLQDPAFGREPGPRLLLAEEGLGPALIQYLIRSHVDARVGVAEWPPLSALDDGAVRRFLFDVPELPSRMVPLLATTPGLTTFETVAPGAALQVGYRHPITLRACPVFPAGGMILFRGDDEPLTLDRMPVMGHVSAFARVTFHEQAGFRRMSPQDVAVPPVTLPIRLLPTVESWHAMRASFIHPSEYPVLRQVVYVLGAQTLRTARIAFTKVGAFLLNPAGVESTPVGHFLRELRPGLFVAAGYDPVPAVEPEVLFQALGSPTDHLVFLLPNTQALGVPSSAFVPLRTAMIEGHAWSPVDAAPLEAALGTEIPRVVYGDAAGAPPTREG